MLQTMARSFMARMCSTVMTSLLPVAVTKMSAFGGGVFHRHDLIAFHRRLQGADRIDFGDHHAAAGLAQRGGRALADVAEAADHATLPAIITSVPRRMPSTSDSRQP
jgi:hypothetical protein